MSVVKIFVIVKGHRIYYIQMFDWSWTALSKGFNRLECFLHEEGRRTDIRNVLFQCLHICYTTCKVQKKKTVSACHTTLSKPYS